MEKNRGFRIIRAALLLVIAFCLIQIGRECYLSYGHKKQQEGIKAVMLQSGAENTAEALAANRLDGLKKLSEANHDLVGWLKIEGTKIDYPVMQKEDDEYYLHHGFYGEEDKYGCLYVRNAADLETPGTNFIIYGHNMRDGSMFGELEKYKGESFFENHSEISFDTLSENRAYEVMAAFETKVTADAGTFRYYTFYQADTEAEFYEFYDNVKALALYDTGVSAKFGDTFLTLSTCDYSEENGRFVVVAKRLVN